MVLPGEIDTPSWQLRALDRSLSDVRARSVERLSQFVLAARELAVETGSSAFTVQQVVARSGLSLKSFYRYFDGKDALLLALIEEDCTVGAQALGGIVDASRDPVDRVRGGCSVCSSSWPGARRATYRCSCASIDGLPSRGPKRLRALQPLVQLLVDDLTRAMATGAVRAGDPARDALSILSMVLLYIHELLLAGRPEGQVSETAAYVWDFCWGGLSS